jgi:hypothetical protein
LALGIILDDTELFLAGLFKHLYIAELKFIYSNCNQPVCVYDLVTFNLKEEKREMNDPKNQKEKVDKNRK